MKAIRVYLLLTLIPALALGETSEVDTRTWRQSGSFDGWTYADLGEPYADGAAKFALASSLCSPVFAARHLVGVDIDVRVSSLATSNRWLQVELLREGETVGAPLPVPFPDKSEKRCRVSIAVARQLAADQIRLTMTGSGNSPVWGVYGLAVACVDALQPFDLQNLRSLSFGFEAGWSNPSGVSSNEVAVAIANAVAEQVNFATRDVFVALTNKSGNALNVSSTIGELYPEYRGERLYVPARTNGLVQIGTQSNPGCLVRSGYWGVGEYQLAVRAWRHKDDGDVMPIGWIGNGQTNLLSTLTLGTEPRDYFIPLSSALEGKDLVFHSTTNRAQGRVYVASVGLVSSVVPAHVETNEVRRVSVSEGERVRVGGLKPSTAYLWSVRGLSGERGSPFADFLPVTTGKLSGFAVQIQ